MVLSAKYIPTVRQAEDGRNEPECLLQEGERRKHVRREGLGL